MNFFSRTVSERTPSGQRQSVQENSYTAHVYSRQSDSLSGVIITDQEYPVRVAFSLLNKILDEFTTKIPRTTWEEKAQAGRTQGKQVLVDYPQLQEYVTKYQDPKQADSIMRVQQELDETKIILVCPTPILLRYSAGETDEMRESSIKRSRACWKGERNWIVWWINRRRFRRVRKVSTRRQRNRQVLPPSLEFHVK